MSNPDSGSVHISIPQTVVGWLAILVAFWLVGRRIGGFLMAFLNVLSGTQIHIGDPSDEDDDEEDVLSAEDAEHPAES